MYTDIKIDILYTISSARINISRYKIKHGDDYIDSIPIWLKFLKTVAINNALTSKKDRFFTGTPDFDAVKG